jgi:acyl carrier protein
MDEETIRDRVRQRITCITGIPPDQIADNASYSDDLGLDSLSMLEIAVDAEMSFQIKIPEHRLDEMRTLSETVRVVSEYLTLSARA